MKQCSVKPNPHLLLRSMLVGRGCGVLGYLFAESSAQRCIVRGTTHDPVVIILESTDRKYVTVKSVEMAILRTRCSRGGLAMVTPRLLLWLLGSGWWDVVQSTRRLLSVEGSLSRGRWCSALGRKLRRRETKYSVNVVVRVPTWELRQRQEHALHNL